MTDNTAALRARPEPLRRVRHKKRGTTYTVLGEAELQISTRRTILEGDMLVVYQGDDGRLWARFSDEFNDGRFEDVSSPPSP